MKGIFVTIFISQSSELRGFLQSPITYSLSLVEILFSSEFSDSETETENSATDRKLLHQVRKSVDEKIMMAIFGACVAERRLSAGCCLMFSFWAY